ncbi:MAG: hypothetical protein Q8N51_00665 [Gammaproteobacteria bacterium]|nr:hypothetical protein [Gammaproteobacteria bacterium]
MTLEFHAATHTYRLDGRSVPSVTEVLKPLYSFDGIPADVMETARVRGSWIHAAVDLYNRGVLDVATVSEDVKPYLANWLRFLDESRAIVTAGEMRVASRKYGYAGTLDTLCEMPLGETLVDVKATAIMPRPVGPQTAGYAQAIMEETGAKKHLRRLCVHLQPGKYRVELLNDSADFTTFLSCLNVNVYNRKFGAHRAA